ncbi:MAG: T9SS type A sorting domain-containing protein [Bacteroidales bacterium]|nr:T9SS type A sorting domain-containing protein [Bacteroidales bacterium]
MIVVIVLTMLVVPTTTAQSVSIWDGTSEIWTQGQGTESSPYLIENAQQLAYIAETVNGGVTHYDNTYFKLTTSVYIDSTTSWEPIGLNGTYYFGGHFDGDNHLVTLYLTTSTLEYVGIFGYAKNGSISNLGSAGRVSRTTESLNVYAGGICGYSTSFFSNCYNLSEISASTTKTLHSPYSSTVSYTGGICGRSTATFTNCHNLGIISSFSDYSSYTTISSTTNYYAYSYAGGICGHSTAGFNNCYNIGHISSDTSYYSYSGGICGYSTASVTDCYNTGDIFSKSYSGGICGYTTDNIIRCHNNGNISSRSTSSSSSYKPHIGGICGYSTATVTNCYNTGNLSSSYYIGGICGYKNSSSIKNCYNVGSLLNGISNGGISGYQGSITNCYYLNTCGHNASTGGTAKTEAQMKSSSFPVILNTDSVVFVIDITPNLNQGYPVFGSVRTLDAENIGNTVATFKGDYHMLYDVDTHGFEYKKNSESDFTIVNTTGEGPVSYNVSGLQGGTAYTYRFFVQKDGVTYRGMDKTFNTVQCSLNGNVVSSTTSLCEGDTVIYSITPTSTNASSYQYVWSTGAQTNAISVTDDAIYTVTVTDNFGCTIVRGKQMTLYPAAVASITGSTVICGNNGTTLTANGGTYYSWNTGSAQRTITVNQPGIYIATVQTVYGCTANDTVEVVAFANPVINGNTVFCSGGYTTLTATGGETYEWSTGATTASINVNTAGTYSVTASTSNGCSGSASVTVIQNEASEVVVSGNTVICSGIGTSLTASSGTDYLWSTGETTQSISVNNPGAYSVTVTNSNGCSNSATQTVSLMEQATISGNNHICSGQSTTLSASGSGSYAWSNGASTSFITVNTPGNYTVTVTLPNGCSSSATVDVTLGTTPTPSITGNTTFCEGEATTLTANGGVSYDWSNGGTSNSTSVNQSGIYSVTATNAEGCSATANVTVTVNPLPSVNISGSNSFCQGDNVTLTATGASTYAWSNASTNAAITVSSAGNYTVTGTDANGCSNTATKSVSVNPTYNTPLTYSMCEGESYNFYGQNITAAGTYTHTLQTVNGCDSVLTLVVTLEALPPTAITGNTTICEGETTTLTATGGVSYAWSNGGTSNSTSVNQSGIYTVTATNAEGCSAIANVTVTVNPLPTITIGGNTTLCAGNSTTLTASGADSYSWSTGENTASVNISAFGIYTVTGTSTEGCSNIANVTVTVSQLPVITISGEMDICAGESTTLTANGGETYLWSDGTTANTLTVNLAGTYQVIGYNAAGCSAMTDATVNVWQPATSEFSIECPDSCYIWNSQTYCTSGNYTQTFQTIHGCDSVVTLHLTITVGIDDHDLGASMTVYPNPTTGTVNVQCTMNNVQVETVDILVYDAFGRLLRSTDGVETQNFASLQTDTHGTSVQTPIDLSRFAPGVYLIKAVADGNVVAVRKVVKQ